MKTTAYQKQYANRFFRTVAISVMVLLGIYSSMAQVGTRLSRVKYKAFEASFGKRSFSVNSDIKKINGMHAGHEGGSLGVMLGNDVFITRIKVGYFYSDSNTPQTQEIFESSVRINAYPLGLAKREFRLRPYLTAGVGLDNVKFFGYYVDNGNTNENGYEPLIGKVAQLSILGGAGVGYSLSQYNDFISLFAEVNGSLPINVSASKSVLNRTTLSQNLAVNIGVRFGINSAKIRHQR